MIILAIDPGIRGVGAALFTPDALLTADYVRNPAKSGNQAAEVVRMALAVEEWVVGAVARQSVTRLVVEWPRIRTRDKSPGDPNDLVALAAVSSAIAARFSHASVVSLYPDEWKGQLSGEATAARVVARLTEAERARVVLHGKGTMVELARGVLTGDRNHNTLDSVGIGLHDLGRFAPTKVFPR
jgi:hypothetical protein